MVRQLGFDDPIVVQYFRYMKELFTGNWGISVSINRREPVWNLIMQRLPQTIDLSLFSIILGSYLGIKLGVVAATHRRETPDSIVRGLSVIGISIPIFFLGMILQYIFGMLIPIFEPIGNRSAPYNNPPLVTGFYIIDALLAGELLKIVDYIWHMALPVACLSFVIFATISRQTRSSMLEELNKDYIRTARAKGCLEKDVIRQHTMHNAIIPTVTLAGLTFAAALSGSFLIEITFGLPGMGQLFIDAIFLRDYWVLNALVFIVTIFFILLNLLTDIIYAKLDPRIMYK